ncbi:hypothetical protein FOPE_02396 [Fonsecaea pedrosoi]|nr:hypothetical protein FOPE_02396 [Fonsecaea pedrosoi]
MAQQAIYTNTFFLREWKVSGLWNSILREAMEANKTQNPGVDNGPWQISPEAYPNDFDTQSNRSDLLVSQLRQNGNQCDTVDHPLIYFEAKRGSPNNYTSNARWRAVRMQIEAWCDLADGVEKGRPCWAIGAIGKEVKFWIFTGSILYNGSNSKMVPVWCDNNQVVVIGWSQPHWQNGDNADDRAPYEYHEGSVPIIIDYMLSHPWAENLQHPSGQGQDAW